MLFIFRNPASVISQYHKPLHCNNKDTSLEIKSCLLFQGRRDLSAPFARNVSCVVTISTSTPDAIPNLNPKCSRGGSTESRRRWTATEFHTCLARRQYRPSRLSRSGATRHEIYLVAMTTSSWYIQRRTERTS